MRLERKLVLIAAAILLAAHLVFMFPRIIGESTGIVRLVLGLALFLLILLRPKPEKPETEWLRWVVALSAVCGMLAVVGGIIIPVRQLQWLGVIALLYACLRWALPSRYDRDICISLLLLYWVHPMPGKIFGCLRVGMQQVSVRGAEMALHCANVRVWADEMVLRTASNTFEVPHECSGMIAATTVLLCALGIGFLFRFKWHSIVAFVIGGLVQVVLLNIARISLMVVLAPGRPPDWAQGFLHDSLGILVLTVIVLLPIEGTLFRRLRTRGTKAPETDRFPYAHPFFTALSRYRFLILLTLLAAVSVPLLAYKLRRYHRAMMISGIVEGLCVTDAEAADRASAAAVDLYPKDANIRMDRVQVLIMRDKYEEARDHLKLVPPSERDTRHTMLLALTLFGLGETADAIFLVNRMTDDEKKLPGVAMVRAEFAAINGDIPTVVSNVVIAARWRWTVLRVRRLFPYLAVRQQWKTIAACYSDEMPQSNRDHALIAVHAHMKVGEMVRAGTILKEGLDRWPEEHDLVEYLSAMAVAMPGSEWEDLFEEQVKTGIKTHTPDELVLYIEACFRIKRPDLAWLVYARLAELDPTHPALALARAQFGDRWFEFRRHYLHLPAASATELVDLKTESSITRAIARAMAPLGEELTEEDIAEQRVEFLREGLAELERRHEEKELTTRLKLMYVAALDTAGRYDQATNMLAELAGEMPEKELEVLHRYATLCDRHARWQKLYEATRRYSLLADYPRMSITLMQINALMHLDMPVYALVVAQRAREQFPDSPRVEQATAAIWMVTGFSEEALFILQNVEGQSSPMLLSRLMRDTERLKEANKLRRTFGVEDVAFGPTKTQHFLLPPAETTLDPEWLPQEEDSDRAERAQSLEDKAKSADSPFVRNMARLMADWHWSDGRGSSADPNKWEEAGRDETEKGILLHALAMRLVNDGRHEEARKVVAHAVRLLPESQVLWRGYIALSAGDRNVVDAAYEACPTDPEIWLAYLVAGTREDGPGDWTLTEIESAVADDRYSVGAMVRAGDFLRRHDMLNSGSIAARHAVAKCQGFMPAYILAIRCALQSGDAQWAIETATEATEYAENAVPFHVLIAQLKTITAEVDGGTLRTLEILAAGLPDDPMWSRKLGDAYLRQGDSRRAMSVLDALITEAPGEKGLRTLLLAAEAARQCGDYDKSVKLLDEARELYPSSRVALNNLVYTLALRPETLPRAQKLLPELIKMFGDSFAVMETAAVVHMKSGDHEKARQYLRNAKDMVEHVHPWWFKANPSMIDLDIYRNDPAKDRATILLAEDIAKAIKEHVEE